MRVEVDETGLRLGSELVQENAGLPLEIAPFEERAERAETEAAEPEQGPRSKARSQ